MTELKELENKMRATMASAKECVDISLQITKEEQSTTAVVEKHWENFVIHLFEYVKKKEKETGQEILKGISLGKLMKFL